MIMSDPKICAAWDAGNNAGLGHAPDAELLESCGIDYETAIRWTLAGDLANDELAHWPATDTELIWNGLAEGEGCIHALGWNRGPWCVDIVVAEDGTATPAGMLP